MTSDQHVCCIFIKADRETVWEALTQAEFTRRYFHETRIESDWQIDSEVIYFNADDSVAVKGEVLEVNYPSRLSFTWHVHYNPVAKEEEPSRVTYQLDEVEDATKLTVIHDNFPSGSVVLPQISEGWIAILSNLKTMIETDTVMAVS